MKNMYLKKFMLPGLMTAALGFSSLNMEAQSTITYSFTGSMQTFVVPPCGVTTVTVEVAGASGNGMNGFAPGLGGKAAGILSVTGGQVLNIFVGGTNAYNGGGIGLGGAHGGGGSDIRVGGTTFTDRVVVAGGGGGAGGDNWQCTTASANGHGGGGTAVGLNFVGGAGGAGYTSGTGCGTNGGNTGGTGGNGTHGGGGGGGGLTSGGGGATCTVPGVAGTGSLGLGGNAFSGGSCGASGGGGGGYYGGGGAAGNNCGAGRGGGGSSWTGNLSSPTFTAGGNTGNGYVRITYFPQPQLLTISGSPTLVCTGSTLTLTASGAAASNYTWSTGAQSTSVLVTPTSNTTYSVGANQGGPCPDYALFTVNMIALPVVSSSVSPNYIVCPNTPITLSGTGADTYVWSGGVQNGVPFTTATATSVYTVTGTNNTTGCSNTNTILVPIYVSTMSVSSPTTICFGTSANLSASGAISYTWNTGSQFPQITVSPNSTTVYTVSGTTSDFCFASNTTTVTVNPSPTVQATSAQAEICRGESVQLTAAGASTYSWNTGGTTSGISVSPNVNTTYTVTGTNSNGCAATGTVFVKVSLCLGVGETSNMSLTGISVFPNPSSGDFTVNSKVEISLTLTNQLGQVVKVLELNQANNYQAKVEHLSQGVYFLTGEKDGQELNQKIIVNH